MPRAVAATLVVIAALVADPEGSHRLLAAQDALIDVASVKRHPPDEASWSINPAPGGRMRFSAMTPERLVSMAYNVTLDQVDKAPAWARQETYDVLVRVPDGGQTNLNSIGPLARQVLLDRFQLKTRMETRELPVYVTVRSRSGGSLGPHLATAQVDCTLGRNGPRATEPAPSPPASLTRCGVGMRPGSIHIGGFPLETLARLLTPLVGRVVVNQTELPGNWDLDLEFTPDQPGGGGSVTLAGEAPSIFTALREQLGLKLESGRAPVPVVVIESLSRPSED